MCTNAHSFAPFSSYTGIKRRKQNCESDPITSSPFPAPLCNFQSLDFFGDVIISVLLPALQRLQRTCECSRWLRSGCSSSRPSFSHFSSTCQVFSVLNQFPAAGYTGLSKKTTGFLGWILKSFLWFFFRRSPRRCILPWLCMWCLLSHKRLKLPLTGSSPVLGSSSPCSSHCLWGFHFQQK